MSSPAAPVTSCLNAGVSARSVETVEMPYGFSSRLVDSTGASRPTSVAAEENFQMPMRPYDAGTGLRYESSSSRSSFRRMLIPQTCGPPCG